MRRLVIWQIRKFSAFCKIKNFAGSGKFIEPDVADLADLDFADMADVADL